MSHLFQKLLPSDPYIVTTNGLIYDYDRKIISLLYQPMMGPTCLSLYITLWSELENNRMWSKGVTHRSLMNYMGLGLADIYQARKKLEGIGLLKTYQKKEEDLNQLIYELQPPLQPVDFFNDDFIGVLLYKTIGSSQFDRLKRFFCKPGFPKDEYKEVTKSFNSVFKSTLVEKKAIHSDLDQPIENDVFLDRAKGNNVELDMGEFSYDLLFMKIKNHVSKKTLNDTELMKEIGRQAFLFDIDALKMGDIVIDSINNQYGDVSVSELHKKVNEWFMIEEPGKTIKLEEIKQPFVLRTQLTEPKTEAEKLIRYFETVSPIQFLTDIGNGAKPVKADIDIINTLFNEIGLNPGVINVLLHYVMLRLDMKLVKSYVEKIGSHWARLGIQTVIEAQEKSVSEHQQYLEWAGGNKSTNKSGRNKKAIRTEMVPKWLNQEESEQPKQKKESTDSIKRKQELLEQLKKMNAEGDHSDAKD